MVERLGPSPWQLNPCRLAPSLPMSPSLDRRAPQRLCAGTCRASQKPIFCEGYGQWKELHVFDVVDGFAIKVVHRVWWEWIWDHVHAEEAEMAAEREHLHDEAMRVDREDAEHLQHLLGCHVDEPVHAQFVRGIKRRAGSLLDVAPS